MTWQHKNASIESQSVTKGTVTIWCPFEDGVKHTHPRVMAGSREVVARCHAGYSRCRTYSIPELPIQRKRTK